MAGRKRKIGPRHKCGKLVPHQIGPDRGTPEQVARRIALLGSHDAKGELDGLLTRLRRHLTTEEYWAAQKAQRTYERYRAAIQAPRLVAGQLEDYIEGSSVSPMSEDDAQEAVDDYKALIQAVRLYSYRGMKEIERFMHGTSPRNLGMLKSSLHALAQHLGYYREKAA